MNSRIVVVGAGISGLTAAHYLNKSGYEVVVLEAQDTPGGRMRQVEIDGIRVNSGARLLFTYYKSVMELIREFNLEDEIEYVGMSDMVCEDLDRSYPVSFALNASALFNSALKKSTRLRLATLLPDLIKAKFATNPDDMTTSAYLDHETMRDYFTRKVGVDFVDKVVNPLFRGARNWNSEDVSPAFFLSTTAHTAGHKAFTFRQGIGYLCQKLASNLDVRYGVAVSGIARKSNEPGVTVQYTENGQDCSLDADIVVCATEGAKAHELVVNKTPEEAVFMSKIRYNSLGIVYHVLKRNPDHAITFYTRDHPSPLAILETVPERNNKPHLFCELAPETVRQVAKESAQDRMDQLIIDDTRKHYAALDQELDYSVNQWIEHMLPVFYPGYIAPLKQFIEYQSTGSQSVYYCGDYLSQALIGGACESGKRVAELICKHNGAS